MTTAFLLINCDHGSEIIVKEQLEKIQDVKEVKQTYGVYDVIAKVESSSHEKFNNIFKNKIRTLKDIHSALTLQVNYDAF